MNSKDFELLKREYSNIQHKIDIKNSPISKGCIELIKNIPVIGEMIDSCIDNKLEKFQNEKRNELIDKIIEDESITKDETLGVEFIIDFLKVNEAVDRLASREKVKYFINLLKNKYFVKDSKIDRNCFDEYLYILNNLSYRQINYLCILSKCTQKIKKEYKEKGEIIHSNNIGYMYKKIENDFKNELNKIGENNIDIAMSILKSTPFVREFKGIFNDTSIICNAPESIYLDESFEEFSNIIDDKFNKKRY